MYHYIQFLCYFSGLYSFLIFYEFNKKYMKKLLLIVMALFIFGGLVNEVCNAKIEIKQYGVDGVVKPDTNVDIQGEAGGEGAKALTSIFLNLADLMSKLIGAVAVLFIVYSGVSIVSAGGDEDQANNGKKGVIWAFAALIMALLVEPMILNVLYGGGDNFKVGEVLANKETIAASIDSGTKELMALVEWAKMLLVTVALGFLIFSGWSMVQAVGEQEDITKQKTAIMWICVGLVILALNEILINEVLYKTELKMGQEQLYVHFTQNPQKGIVEFVALIKFVLKFAAVIAFSAFVIGGGMMIFSFANEELVETGKKVLLDAAIGLVVIIISYALVASLMTGKFTGG